MVKELAVMLYTTLAGFGASVSALCFSDLAAKKSAIIYSYMSKAPEITDKVIEAANTVATQYIVNNDFPILVAGALTGIFAGYCVGMAIYDAANKDEEAVRRDYKTVLED